MTWTLRLIKWLLKHNWHFDYTWGTLSFIYCNDEPQIRNEQEAKRILKTLKADKNYK